MVQGLGFSVLAAVAGPRVPGGGVTRQGVALTDLQSLVDCQMISLSLAFPLFLPLFLSRSLARESVCCLLVLNSVTSALQ